jgi:lipoyl(octanoyl) transferase
MIAPRQLGSYETLFADDDDDALHHEQQKAPLSSERLVRLENFIPSFSSAGGAQMVTMIEYNAAWDIQKKLLQGQLDRLAAADDVEASSPFLRHSNDSISNNEGAVDTEYGVDTVLFLQHTPVYTLGTGSDPRFVKDNSNSNNIPVVRMDRGGGVTHHGPGQLTVYPILDLRNYKQDIHWYVRALEEVVLQALTRCGIDHAERQAAVTGVWVNDHKVAAVGVKCHRWITQHGFAINVRPESLCNFNGIVACGLEGRQVGCVADSIPNVTMEEMVVHVKDALEDVFCIQLVERREDHNVLQQQQQQQVNERLRARAPAVVAVKNAYTAIRTRLHATWSNGQASTCQ